jgi:cytochrome c-type biogenesis protein CcmE
MNYKKFTIFIIAMVLMVAAIISMSSDLFSPYISFTEAKKRNNDYVQIIGKLDKKNPVLTTELGFSFTMRDDQSNTIKVYSNESKPQNFDHAEQIVLKGRYKPKQKHFEAKEILVK